MKQPDGHILPFLKNKKEKEISELLKLDLKETRDELYKRINTRVDEMIRMGLEEEARQLYELQAS